MRALALIVLAAGCQDYTVNPTDKEPTGGLDSEPIDCPPQVPDCWDTAEDSEPIDSVVVVDPEDCDVRVAEFKDIPVVEECIGSGGGGEVEDAFDLVIEYFYGSAGSGVIVMPAVGNLTDDNGDGRVDEDDIPDIAFTTWSANTLVALNGDGSGEIFEISGFDGQGGVTIADVDADGEPEVVAIRSGYKISAVDASGTIEWTSASFPMMSYPQPTVADLDGDGMPEAIGDVGIVNGEDGTTVGTMTGLTNSWRTPIAADIDQDGEQEIILANGVFDSTGALKWKNSGTGAGNFAAVADVDGDVGGEVFFVSGSTMYLHDDDGTLLKSTTIPGTNPGPPSVADFDGDGQVEIAIPANTQISVFEIDGTKNWTQPMNDTSGLAGCSGYDMNGDGAYEVLFADQDALRIYDGATGTVLYENYNHSSGTVWEYPVIADVDQDGSAEIVVASNGTLMGVTVFGHAGDGWPESGPTWGTHDFAVTNLNPDGSVPVVPDPSWLEYNVFRARPWVDDPAFSDLVVEMDDICIADCNNGPIKVSFQVGNQGAVEVPAGTPWAWYRVDGELYTLVTTGLLDAIPSGQAPAGFSISVTPDAFGTDGFVLSVDDDGTGAELVSECDEDNNKVVWADSICGEG